MDNTIIEYLLKLYLIGYKSLSDDHYNKIITNLINQTKSKKNNKR